MLAWSKFIPIHSISHSFYSYARLFQSRSDPRNSARNMNWRWIWKKRCSPSCHFIHNTNHGWDNAFDSHTTCAYFVPNVQASSISHLFRAPPRAFRELCTSPHRCNILEYRHTSTPRWKSFPGIFSVCLFPSSNTVWCCNLISCFT